MKAMVLNEYGENAEFRLTELAMPEVQPGQVVVRVAATSVNTVDTMIRQMGQKDLPLSPDLPGALKPLLDENRYGLKDVGNAYDRLTSGRAVGKVVIEI